MCVCVAGSLELPRGDKSRGCWSWEGCGPGHGAWAAVCDTPVSADFFIMVVGVLDFVLIQVNSSSTHAIHNQRVFRIFRVFKTLRALRAIRVLRRLRLAGPQLPMTRL